MAKCKSKTKKGRRCRRNPVKGGTRCASHGRKKKKAHRRKKLRRRNPLQNGRPDAGCNCHSCEAARKRAGRGWTFSIRRKKEYGLAERVGMFGVNEDESKRWVRRSSRAWRRNPIPKELPLDLLQLPDWLSLTPPSECPSCDEATDPRWKVCPYCEKDLVSKNLKTAEWFRNIQVDIRSYKEKANPVFIVMQNSGQYEQDSATSYHLSLDGAMDNIRSSVLQSGDYTFWRGGYQEESRLYFPYYIQVEDLLP